MTKLEHIELRIPYVEFNLKDAIFIAVRRGRPPEPQTQLSPFDKFKSLTQKFLAVPNDESGKNDG